MGNFGCLLTKQYLYTTYLQEITNKTKKRSITALAGEKKKISFFFFLVCNRTELTCSSVLASITTEILTTETHFVIWYFTIREIHPAVNVVVSSGKAPT